MKSIFKKIALVLAIAMVITMLPAKAASAASADAPDMYETLLLYLDSGNGEGSDVTGTYKSERYASVWGWRENGYDKVEFASADPSIATVNSKGKVTAMKVGKTIVTATFTGDGVNTEVKECKVTVKRNATKVGLSADSAKQVQAGFSVGEKVQLTAVRKDTDGKTEWNKTQKVYTTDSLRFRSSNEEVFKVAKTNGLLTAVGEGEATLTIWAVQSEGRDAATGEYPAGVSRDYTVKVYDGGVIAAKQVSTTKVALTCGSADTAAAIAKDFSKLTATYTLNDNKITTYIKSASVDAADAKVVVVELYTSMDKNVVYNFTYNEKTVSLTAVDPDAIASIRIVTTQAKVETNTEIKVEFLDVNGVVINAGPNALTFTAADEASADYYVDNSGYIYFFEAGKTAKVTVTYDMGYDENGNKIPDLTASAVIVSKVASDSDTVVGYAVLDLDNTWTWASTVNTYTTGVLHLVKDNNVQLFVKYTVKNYDGSTSTYYNTSINDDDMESDNGSVFTFKYVSTNDAVVFADETSGQLYPVSAGSAQIIIYRVVGENEVVVGAVGVKVEASKIFTAFKANLGGNKLSTKNTIRLNVDAKDQLDESLSSAVTYKAKLVNTSKDVTIVLKSDGNHELPLNDEYTEIEGTPFTGNGAYWFELQAKNAPTKATTVKISLQVSYGDITKVIVLTLTAKAVDPASTEKLTYSLDLGAAGTSIDMNLPQAASWWSDLHTTIQLNAYDSQGYFVKTIAMSNTKEPGVGEFGFTVTKDNIEVQMGAGSQQKWIFAPVTISGSAVTDTVTGSAIDKVLSFKNGDEKSDSKLVGTYAVKVYQGVASNGKTVYKPIGVKNIVVKDSTVVPTVTVSSTKTTSTDKGTMLDLLKDMRADGKLVITRAGSNVSGYFEIIDVELSNNTEQRVYVKSITVTETLNCAGQWKSKWHGKTHTYKITINKMFYKE